MLKGRIHTLADTASEISTYLNSCKKKKKIPLKQTGPTQQPPIARLWEGPNSKIQVNDATHLSLDCSFMLKERITAEFLISTTHKNGTPKIKRLPQKISQPN